MGGFCVCAVCVACVAFAIKRLLFAPRLLALKSEII